MIGLAVLGGTGLYLKHWAALPLPITEDTVFIVKPGASFAQVASTLAALGVVEPWRFSLLARQRDAQASAQSGEYRVVPGATAEDLLHKLTTGDVVQHHYRIVEGTTVRELLLHLAQDDRLLFDLADATPEDILARVGLPERHAEGLFFPDTYQFIRGYAASALLRRAYAKMDAELAAAWRERNPTVPYASSYEALIMASIVEKETGAAADRVRVAGVFTRRLAQRMRLQSDPTVIYGLGSAFHGDLTRAHLKADGPYNTYTRASLPPTPIALPGRASIEAALHPAEGDALYFVSRGDGTSQFSATLAEHNAAVRRYQLQ